MEYLRCQICGEKISVNSCPCSLGEHLVQKHPELQVTHFTCANASRPCCCTCKGAANKRKNTVQDCPNIKMGRCPSKCRGTSRSKSGIFKTTVETWRPGPQKVTCPVCCQTDVPCIRKQRKKVAYTSFGAMCILSCWPLCFLPFLMPEGSCVELFCKHCGSYLGQYNRKTGTLTTCCTDNERKTKVPCNMCS